jgi:two-component system response regulator NreC
MKEAVRVLLCDDQIAVRSHLRKMLASVATIQIVGEATGGHAGVRMALNLMPDVVIMDISMPDLNGILATKQILAVAPETKVIIFSAECSPQIAEQALSAGAKAYLVKSANGEELIRVIELVLRGERYVSPVINYEGAPMQKEASSQPPKTGAPLAEGHGPIRVLLVDDARHVRERLAEMLSSLNGVQVVGQAPDVPLALQLIEELRPDVLILEMELPGQTGMDLLSSIRENASKPLIIILTSLDYPVLRRACAELGADFYFYKPAEFEKVLEVCENLAKRTVKRVAAPPENSARLH